MQRKYHYEWAAYTDNLSYGRVFITRGRSYEAVALAAVRAQKVCYVVRRERVYEN